MGSVRTSCFLGTLAFFLCCANGCASGRSLEVEYGRRVRQRDIDTIPADIAAVSTKVVAYDDNNPPPLNNSLLRPDVLHLVVAEGAVPRHAGVTRIELSFIPVPGNSPVFTRVGDTLTLRFGRDGVLVDIVEIPPGPREVNWRVVSLPETLPATKKQ